MRQFMSKGIKANTVLFLLVFILSLTLGDRVSASVDLTLIPSTGIPMSSGTIEKVNYENAGSPVNRYSMYFESGYQSWMRIYNDNDNATSGYLRLAPPSGLTGSYTFSVKACSYLTSDCDVESFTVSISEASQPLYINMDSFSVEEGTSFSKAFTVFGGVPNYTISISGQFSNGNRPYPLMPDKRLVCYGDTACITPLLGMVTEQDFPFTLHATDAQGSTASVDFTITVTDVPKIDAPGTPVMFDPVVNNDQGEVALSWSSVSGDPNWYQVTCFGNGQTFEIRPSPETGTQIVLNSADGISADILYSAYVHAHNTSGYSNRSNTVNFELSETPPPDNHSPSVSCQQCPSVSHIGAQEVFYIRVEDADDDWVRLNVDWGDGTPQMDTGLSFSNVTNVLDHIYTQEGTYTIEIQAQDEHGANGNILSHSIVVNDATPPASGDYAQGYLLGSPGSNGSATPMVGFGVNAVTGNFYHEETDATLPGKEIPFIFTRSYNSLSTDLDGFGNELPTPLGSKWTHAYHILLRTDAAENNIEVIWGDGRRDGFVKSGSTWIGSTPGNFSQIAKPSLSGYTWELTTRNQMKYRFNSQQRIVEIKGRTTNTAMQFSYDVNGNLESIADTSGRNISLSYDASDRIVGVNLPPSRQIVYSYAVGMLSSATDMRGNSRQYMYTDENLRELHWATSTAYPKLQITYDDESRVINQKTGHHLQTSGTGSYTFDWQTADTLTYNAPNGRWIKFVKDELNRIVQITPSGGKTKNIEYLSDTGPESLLTENIEDFEENTYGTEFTDANLTRFDLPDGRLYRMDYNESNDMTLLISPEGLTLSVPRRTSGRPDSISASGAGVTNAVAIDVTYTTDELLKEIVNSNDAQSGVKTVVETYNSQHLPENVRSYKTESDSLLTVYAYDSAGRVASIEDHRGTLACFYYDGNDNITDIVTGLTGSCSKAPASETVRHTHYDYDEDNRVKSLTQGYGGPSPRTISNSYNTNTGLLYKTCESSRCVEYTYDDNLNIRKIAYPSGREDLYYYLTDGKVQIERANANGCQGSLDRIERREYNGNGELLTISSCVSMDDPGEPTSDCAKNVRSRFLRDAAGRVYQVQRLVDNSGAVRTTNYAYSFDGRIVTVSNYGDNGNTIYESDALGRLIRVTENRGSSSYTARAEYDGNGRLVKITDPDGFSTTYTYDRLGRMLSKTDIQGTIQWSYNDSTGTVRRTEPDSATVDFTFDRLGQLTQTATSDGLAFTYSYDSLGRLASESWSGNGNNGSRTYAYNNYGELIQTSGPFGKTVGYSHDNSGRLKTRTFGGSTITYGYNAFDQIDTMATPAGNFSFSYKNFTRMLGRIGYPNGVETMLTRNELGELIQQTTRNYSNFLEYQITHDALGRRASIDSKQPTQASFPDEDMTFDYDASGMLSTLNGASVSSDDRGNITSIPSPYALNLSYDVLNRLTQAETTQHFYDVSRKRIKTVRNGSETRYLWDVNSGLPDIVAQMDSSNTVKSKYIHGPGGLLATISDGKTRFVHQDFNSNVVAVTDTSGSVAGSYAYLPYGNLAGSSGEDDIPFKFAGGVGVITDPEGLIYMRARYYNPNIRQFTSADLVPGKFTRPQSLNRYAYIEGMALGGVDPSGLDPTSIFLDPITDGARIFCSKI